MASSGGDETELIQATEQWFMRRGIPHFIDGYRASEDVFTRTLPALSLVVLVEVLGAANLQWSWWRNLAALVAASLLLLAVWAAINRVRGRPGLQRPDTIGPVELVAFVVVPSLLPLIFGGQQRSALVTGLVNVTVLAGIYLVTSYGLIPMTRWALGQTGRQIGAVAGLLGRALPLLLLFSVALFINTEVWQVAASLDGLLFWATVLFFVLIGTTFLILRLPGEVGALRDQLTGHALVEACVGSPVAEAASWIVADEQVEQVPLTRRQQGNVILVLLFSQAVQILLVTLTVAGFFFVFGLIAIRPEVISAWLGEIDPGVIATWHVLGRDLHVTWALVHVAGFLGTLSGFYFTVYVITDATYRQEFFTEIVDEVRQSLAVRNVYLALLGSRPR